MYATAGADRFEIINGPEDGTEFPVTRAPFDIGGDPGCAVNAQMDEEVRMFHARVAVVSKGYCIRSLKGAPVWVNGKRVGRFRSRVARARDVVRVGRTEFMVHLAEGGLASRSYGLPMESDFRYALRSLGRALAFLLGFFGRILTHRRIRFLVVIAVLVGIACIVSPPFRAWFTYWMSYAWAWIVYGFQWALYQIRGGS